MFWIGTSGYNYLEWRGSFYPADLPSAKMLPFYAARFPTVEINYTFYRMPTDAMLRGWAAATPERFKLTLKSPRRITHDAKLQNCRPLVETFVTTAATLHEKLGALLFQLPPTFKIALPVLDDFLGWLPAGIRVAFEFRHASWFVPDVFARLQRHNAALCIAESEKLSTPVEATADFGYFRLRDEGYTAADLRQWAARLRDLHARGGDIFVYFKHEEAGKGPEFAKDLMRLLEVQGHDTP
jgi:uncharacterized protein YecE (DUF72 family)